MAVILTAGWLKTGWVSAPAPQVIANQAYRELWRDRLEGQAGAVEKFRQAAVLDPAFPYRWSDLGDALASAGRMSEAQNCFRRAVELAPDSPQIALRAANFYLRRREIVPALQLGAAVLRRTSACDRMVFSSWLRFGGETSGILRVGIGPDRRASEAWFAFLIESANEPALSETWKWMEQNSQVTTAEAITWSEWLSARHRDKDGFLVWKRYVAVEPEYGARNGIDNPGFERPPDGKGFGWRIQPSAGVKAGIDPAVAHSGRSSLRLDFDGSANIDFHHVAQKVWLEPGRYRLTAWIRTERLSTDRGVALLVSGSSTQALSGTQGWTQVSTDLTVRSASTAEVQVVRQPSWRFDGKISGSVWIDDVELRRIASAQGLSKRL